jgi:hypothetical protein
MGYVFYQTVPGSVTPEAVGQIARVGLLYDDVLNVTGLQDVPSPVAMPAPMERSTRASMGMDGAMFMAGSEQLELFVANARQYWVAAMFHNNANCVF